MKLLHVVGTRPNFVKMAPVIAALRRLDPGGRHVLVHTGQHYDAGMSAVFFEELGIPEPDVHLGVGSGGHGAQTGRVMEAVEARLLAMDPAPAGVVVVGDVNSTMAAALAAVKLGVPVAHVEAGLRSFDRTMPEEINRIVTDAVADLLYVTERSGEENLLREGADPAKVRLVGDVMIDTLIHELPAARAAGDPARHGLSPGGYGVVTLHRPSNVDGEERLRAVVEFLRRASGRLPLLFPVHPRTGERLERFGLRERLAEGGGVRLLPPLGYRENLGLVASAKVVITDSGGLQEETSFLRVPCITMRDTTERPITVERGTSTLVGSDHARAEGLLDAVMAGSYKAGGEIPGWDGRAAGRIVEDLVREWGGP
ncbi:MAG: UDP-N-acetylglucosamine 2-epimerase (non-hydrolyzing) [Planctomycetaceae bacterium]|nr:UDP-N-acetylglucosamine 2-epimerase (non-hydrolyzing) [Planctomycetaceae bacterium]